MLQGKRGFDILKRGFVGLSLSENRQVLSCVGVAFCLSR